MRSRLKRGAAVTVDAALGVLAPLIVRGRPAVANPPHPRVLLVRCDHIGDLVMATAVLEPLRAVLQPSRLDVLVGPWAAPLLVGHPLVDDVIVYATPWWSAARGAGGGSRLRALGRLPGVIRRLRAARYDVGIDLRGDLRQIFFFLALGGCLERVSTDRTGGRRLLTRVWPFDPSLHDVEKNAAIVGMLGAHRSTRLAPPALPALPPSLVQELTSASGPRGFVVVATRGTEENRTWPTGHAIRFVNDARAGLGLGTVYVGGLADRPSGDAIAAGGAPLLNLAGRTTLTETVGVMARAASVVAVDSGPMHLAALAGVSIVALFGPGDPRQCRPWAACTRIATTGAPCGCIHARCDVHAGPGRCMIALGPELVLSELKLLLDTT